MKKILFIFSLLVLSILPVLKSQCLFQDSSYPLLPTNLPPDQLFESKNGIHLPCSGEIRVLIIFAEVNWDVNPSQDPDPNGTTNWPKHGLPIWKDVFFDANYPGLGNEIGTITKYYSQASSGNYRVIGDYLVNPNNGGCFIINKSSYSNIFAIGTPIVAAVNTNMSTIVTGHGLNSIDYFDKWTITGGGLPKITPSIDNPKKYDHIIIVLRNWENGACGYSTGGNVGNLIGHTSDSYCVFGTNGGSISTSVCRHEYGHLLYGGNNFHAGGGGWGVGSGEYFIPIDGGYGNMGLYNSSLLCWNGWDRQRMDWKPAGNIYNPSARNENNTSEVNGEIDANNPSGAGVYWLRDFVVTGDALKIKLPFIPSNLYPEFLWIENHNTINKNNNEFDQFQFQQDFSCVQDAAYGLYMYKQIDKNIRQSSNYSDIFGGYAYYLKPILADGNFDYEFETNTVNNGCVADFQVQAFTKLAERNNPFTGGCDWGNIEVDNGIGNTNSVNNILETVEGITPQVEKIGSQYYKNLFSIGSTRNAFTLEGNKKIGIGTNPSSANVINLVRNNQYVVQGAPNVRKIYLNGVSVEILEQTTDGNIKVRVRFDDVDVNNDIRWCADTIETTPVVTLTGYSLNLKENKVITIDHGKTANRINNPVLINGEKIFASPTVFNVRPNTFFNMEKGSKLIIDNGSTMNMESNSRLDIGVNANIIIRNGSKMIMKSSSVIRADSNAKIIVEPNGQLIIDGALITAKDVNILWQGIEVQGNTNLPQTPANQGYVELKNGARIEYANTAIYTAKSNANDTDDPNGYGGIVKVDNTTFYNNYSSIWIKNYYNPFGAPQTNQSTISNSTFEVDKPYYDMVETPPGFINLAYVKDVKIQRNVFKNTCTITPFGNRNYGIYSIDASYNVGENNQFVGLKYGILSMNTIPSFTPTIEHCTFINCYRGIYLSGVTNPTVTFNTMTVPSDNNNCYGLYLDNCPTFNVQENTFAGTSTTNGDFGIIINNCGETSKKIYNNVFTNINIGTQAQNQNKNASGSTGLQIKCNDYTNTLYDITVMKDATVTIGGIARYQGVNGTQPWNPAGNLFSHNTMDYTNSVRSNITYVNHNSPRCIPSIDGNITLSPSSFPWYDKPTCCPSEFTEGSGDIAGLKSSISGSQNLINTTNVQLQTLVDGGNTTLLETQVDNSMPPQALQLRNNLISKSPYLSDSVMVSAIENEGGLPPSMLTQVLVQNPSGAKSPDVLDKLDSRENPLPKYMMQQILAGQNRIADKEKLESKVCSYTLQRDMAWDKIERIYKNDTIHPWANDSLLVLYGSDPRLSTKYELVFAKIGKNQNNEAMQLLNSLPQYFMMEESQNEEYNDYMVLAGIYANLKQNNKIWQDMSNVQKQALQVLAGKQKNRADMYAINILRTTGVYSYSEPILQAGSGGGKMLFGIGKYNNSQSINTDVQFKVYPNPAKDYFLIDYKLAAETAGAKIEISDVTGKMVKSIVIADMQNQLVVETKDLQNGMYYVQLKSSAGNKLVKISIIK